MNIALIVLDTLRKDRIAPYNRTIDFTPALSDFAADATTYTNAISQAPWSLPAHASLLTGLYPWQHGASQRFPYLHAGTRLQTVLGDAGFNTVAIHNNEWLLPVTGVTDGFDRVVTRSEWTRLLRQPWRIDRLEPLRSAVIRLGSWGNLRRTITQTSDLSDELSATQSVLETHGDDPLFLFLNLTSAHFPYNPPDQYAEDAAHQYRSRPLENGGPVVPAEIDRLSALYDAEVAYLDTVFSQVIESFKAAGLYDETLFVVVGDHGELLGEDEILGHHFSVRDELIEVPLFVKPPGGGDGRNDTLIETRELYYRLCKAAGTERTDPGRLYPDRACGIYHEPVIYGSRLPSARRELDTAQFYAVADQDKRVLTDDSAVPQHRSPDRQLVGEPSDG